MPWEKQATNKRRKNTKRTKKEKKKNIGRSEDTKKEGMEGKRVK